MARAVLRFGGMKSLLIALVVGGTATAAPAPDFLDHAPPPPVAPGQAATAGASTVIEPGDIIVFAHDSNALLPSETGQVDRAAQWLRAHPDYNVVLEGYTDETGDRSYNAGLAFARAAAVKARLAEDGINPDRVVLVAYSECRVLDRRVAMYATRIHGETIAGDAIRRGAARATWFYAGSTFDMGPGT